MTETGRDNPGSRWSDDEARGGEHSEHTKARAAAQGTTPNSSDYWDYYGRVLKYDIATETVTSHIEGGPHSESSPTISNYAETHLSNPDGLSTMTINGKPYMIICEDLNGTSAGRMPAGVTNRACELFLLDLDITNPTVDDLVRIGVGPVGAEITGACATPDNKTLLVNSQHPNTANPYPYNYSLTYALTGWELEQVVAVHELKKKNELFKFYPNPSNGKVTFDKIEDIGLYGADGQLIVTFMQVSEINLSHQASGVYFLRNAEGATKKLVLNN
jgi:hypothetical protein